MPVWKLPFLAFKIQKPRIGPPIQVPVADKQTLIETKRFAGDERSRRRRRSSSARPTQGLGHIPLQPGHRRLRRNPRHHPRWPPRLRRQHVQQPSLLRGRPPPPVGPPLGSQRPIRCPTLHQCLPLLPLRRHLPQAPSPLRP